jgi:hypothetical protein
MYSLIFSGICAPWNEAGYKKLIKPIRGGRFFIIGNNIDGGQLPFLIHD